MTPLKAPSSEPIILLVDDDADIRTAIRHSLSQKGYAVEIAMDGKEALSRLTRAPSISLVISDVCMPGLDGMALLTAVQKLSPSTPVVLITAYGTVANAIQALKKGARDYLLKPFSNAQLHQVVKNIFVAGNPSGKDVLRKAISPVRGTDNAMKEVWQTVARVSESSATILIQGESGVGKEIIARHIHYLSPRQGKPFVAINCAAIPENLLESELFGFAKGSFTGAIADKKGKFEIAEDGTLLLDEISEMPFNLQSKLLRVLQEREVFPIGDRTPVPVRARLIATTNRDLWQWVKSGNFREDLYYRLDVISIVIPPLRERRDDIIPLAQHFLDELNRANSEHAVSLTDEATAYLRSLDWPGNARELENSITRLALLAPNPRISKTDCVHLLRDHAQHHSKGMPNTALSPLQTSQNTPLRKLEEIEREAILHTLKECRGNRSQTARILGISVRTLHNKLKAADSKGDL